MKPCSFTGIGSLPYRSPKRAVSYLFRHYEIPFLPQLPKRHKNEFMIFQWLEPSYYGALDDFLKRCDSQKIFKVQLAGPYTIVKSTLPNSIETPDLYQDFIQFFIDKTAAFLKLFQVKNKMWIIFDEPFLNELSAGQLFSNLDRIILEIGKKVDCSKFLFGLHSCNRWTPSLFSQFYDTRLRLISFDVELGGNAIFQDRQKLFEYLKKGFLLWGVVPTRPKSYRAMKSDHFLRYLQTKNLQKKEVLNILRRSHFTPACGTATLRLKDEQTIARKLREISIETRHYYERGS